MPPSSKPNIVLFLTDQLRRDALGLYGNTICRTPHLDALANSGVVFDNAYTTSPVCSPSRSSLLTGLYAHNHGVMMNTHISPAWNRGLNTEIPTFSSLLKDHNYALDYVGKWHVHEDLPPQSYGFDQYINYNSKHEAIPESLISIDFPGGSQPVAGTLNAPLEQSKPWVNTEHGVSRIRERANSDQPFFLRVDLTAPHFPNIVPEPYASLYDETPIPPWPNFSETFKNKPSSHRRKHQEFQLQDKEWSWWEPVIAKYYSEVTLIDACVGKLMAAIEQAGIINDTIIIFSTDHGDALGSHRHFEKAGTMYDEVFRIPLIIKSPNSRPNRIQSFVRLMDLMPTILDFATISKPEKLDALSLVPFIKGHTPAEWPDSIYAEHHGEVWGYQTQRMVRTTDWKYVFNPHDLDELYDLQSDPHEMHNCIDDPSASSKLLEMKGRLIGWNDATSDMLQWNWVRWNFPPGIPPLSPL